MLDTLNLPIYGISPTAEAAIVQWLESRFGEGFPNLTQSQASSLIYLSSAVAVYGWDEAIEEFLTQSALPPKQRSTQWRQMAIPIGLMQTMSQNGEEIATACIRIVSRFGKRSDVSAPIGCDIYQDLSGPSQKRILDRHVRIQSAPKPYPQTISGGGRNACTA